MLGKTQGTEGEIAQPVTSDAVSMLWGTLAGAAGGLVLGGTIAWTVSPAWSITTAIIVFHVTLAMMAMGAWTAPSLISDPEQDARLDAKQ